MKEKDKTKEKTIKGIIIEIVVSLVLIALDLGYMLILIVKYDNRTSKLQDSIGLPIFVLFCLLMGLMYAIFTLFKLIKIKNNKY